MQVRCQFQLAHGLEKELDEEREEVILRDHHGQWSCSSSGEEGLALLAAMMEVHGSTLQPPISLRAKGGVSLFSGMEFSTMFLPAFFGITRQ